MDVWPGWWNILNVESMEFMVGDCVDEYTARRWCAHYAKKYPNAEFEVVQVDFAHPRWFREEYQDHLDQNVWE